MAFRLEQVNSLDKAVRDAPTANFGRMRPLVMRCGALGDMVLLSVLIQQLHARFAQPVDVITSGAWSRPLLAAQPNVGEVVTIRSRRFPYWASVSQRMLVRWLQQRGAGPTWFADPFDAGRDLLRRGGISDDQVADYRDLAEIPGEHFATRWARFAELTPRAFQGAIPPANNIASKNAILNAQRFRPLLRPWLEKRDLLGRKVVVAQAGNKRTMRAGSLRRKSNTKYWPIDRWAAVLRAVRAECPTHAIVLLGVEAERRLNAQIASASGLPDIHNVAGEVPVELLLPLLESADSMISVDTGPAHAAAALGCPTVCLFGRSDPNLYRPGGMTTPVTVLTGNVDGEPNILGISVAEVTEAWRTLRTTAALAHAFG